MRNLKRALSLTLASIMLLGMMVVGSSAAGYKDVNDEHNVEAIEVLQAVEIMVGDDGGNFNPDKNVTRNEMAVIMSKMMDYRVATYAGTSPFTDVPSWAEPYVAACYTNGITSGTSATTYNGSGNVTTAQAALMVMKALGYFQNNVDFGSDWQLATTRQANRIDLLVGVKAAVKEPMTRNDVARLVLNGLESGTVEVDNSNNISVSVGGEMVSIGGTKYDFVTSTEDYAYAINPDASTTNYTDATASVVELGEKLYQGALTKDAWEKNNRDAFERPADHWEYQGKDIGTYTKEANTTFTKKVTTKALYNAVGSAACDYKWYVSVDGTIQGDTGFGSLVNSNKTDDNNCFLQECIGAASELRTGNGVLTQVYVDGNRSRVYVSVIHYFPAEVLRVNNANDADRSITLSNLDNSNGADTNDVFETADFAEDDIVVYSYSKKSEAIEEVCLAERIEGKVTQARALEDGTKNEGDHFTLDETKYNYNKTVSAGAPRRLTTENVNNNMVGYLDQFGYVIYIDDAAATYDYAYVLTMGSRDDEFGGLKDDTRAADGKTWFARLVLTDGTVVKAETDAKNNSLLHHIVSYSVDSKGVYALRDQSTIKDKNDTGVIGNGTVKVENGAAGIRINGEPYTANADTVFVIADSDDESADDFNYRVYTGIKNVPDIESLSASTLSVVAVGTNGIAKVVYIQDADVSGTKDVIFIESNPGAKFDKSTGSTRNYVINAVEDGEVVTLLVKENSLAADKLVKTGTRAEGYAPILGTSKSIVAAEYLTRDADGIVTNVKLYGDELNSDGDGFKIGDGTLRAERQTVGVGSTRYGYSDNTVVVRYDVKSESFYVEKNLNGIKNDADDVVLGILDTGSLTGICYLNTSEGAGKEPGKGSSTDPETPVETKGNVKPAKGEPVVMNGTTYGKLGTDRLGNLSMSISFKAPAWAEGVNPNAKLDVTIKDDVGTVKTLTGKTAAGSDGVYKYETNGNGDLSDLKTAIAGGKIDESKLTVEFSNVKWTNAKVEYYVTDGTTETKLTTAPGDKQMAIGEAAKAPFAFTYTIPSGSEMVGANLKATYTGMTATEKSGEVTFASGDAVTLHDAYAAGGAVVKIVIGNVKKTVDTSTKYTVQAVGNAAGEVKFAVVDSAPANAAAVEAIAASEWKDSVEAAKDKIVLIKSVKTGVKLTGVTAVEPTGGSVSASDVDSNTGYYKFTMGQKAVNVTAVTTNEVKVVKGFATSTASAINLKVSATPVGTDAEKFQLAYDWLTANKPAWGVTKVTDPDGNLIGLKTSGNMDIPASAITVASDLKVVTIDGVEVVGAASDETPAALLGLAGKTDDNANLYVKVTASGSTKAVATNSATDADVADGCVVDTNKEAYYAKLDTNALAITANNAIDDTTGSKTATAVVKSGSANAFQDTNWYVAIGKGFTVTVTSKKTIAAGGSGYNFVIPAAPTNGTATVSGEITAADGIAEDGTVDVTVTVTGVSGVLGTITLSVAPKS